MRDAGDAFTMFPDALLSALYEEGCTVSFYGAQARLQRQRLHEMLVPSNRLLACNYRHLSGAWLRVSS